MGRGNGDDEGIDLAGRQQRGFESVGHEPAEPWWQGNSQFSEPEWGYENFPGELSGRLPFLARGGEFHLAHFGEHHPEIYNRASWEWKAKDPAAANFDPAVESEQGDIAWALAADGDLEIVVHLPPLAHSTIKPQVASEAAELICEYLYDSGAPDESLRPRFCS